MYSGSLRVDGSHGIDLQKITIPTRAIPKTPLESFILRINCCLSVNALKIVRYVPLNIAMRSYGRSCLYTSLVMVSYSRYAALTRNSRHVATAMICEPQSLQACPAPLVHRVFLVWALPNQQFLPISGIRLHRDWPLYVTPEFPLPEKQ